MNLKNATILITGASGGIGEALVRAFDRERSNIVMASRNKARLDAIASGLHSAWVIQADLSDPDQAMAMIDNTVGHFGRIDVLINNAASIIVTDTVNVSPEDLETAFRTNVVSPVMAIRQSLKYMKEQGSGVIINIGSPGFMMGVPF
ncbi:MAG: SDR family oxidoreductase, partial [Bacteroidota bacterium]|nr:SDR family oxidoreductase [Bacteroidota bacterium]